VLASTATTTGLFVLAGVLVGGLLTGAVNYALERRREHHRGKVAIRLLEIELAISAASADPIIDDGRWLTWNFGRAYRTWDEYREDAAGALSDDEWIKLSLGFYAIDVVERGFAKLAVGTSLDPTGLAVINEARQNLYEASNALRRRLGMDEIKPGP
jgi:hypothetical protein